MHHEDIKSSIRKTGITSADLARHIEVSPQVVSNVIHGTAKSARVANAISKLVGVPVAELWPGKYEKAKKPSVAALMASGKRAA